MDIYQFVRVLGFSAEYVEKIPPNEREIYKILYREEMKKQQQQNKSGGNTIGQGIEVP
jgi:hypothetical protein